MTPSSAVRPMQHPPRMWAVVGMSNRISGIPDRGSPSSLAATRRAMAVASGMLARGRGPRSLRVARRPVHRLRTIRKVPSAACM